MRAKMELFIVPVELALIAVFTWYSNEYGYYLGYLTASYIFMTIIMRLCNGLVDKSTFLTYVKFQTPIGLAFIIRYFYSIDSIFVSIPIGLAIIVFHYLVLDRSTVKISYGLLNELKHNRS